MASRAAAEPSPLVRLALGNVKEATGCKYRTLDPVWEEGFSFSVSNPLTQSLTLEVRSNPPRPADTGGTVQPPHLTLEVRSNPLTQSLTLEVRSNPLT